MTGLQKIIETISDNTASQAESVIAAAEARATEIVKTAEIQAGKSRQAELEKAEQDGARIVENAKAEANAKAGKELLSVKVNSVYEIIELAIDKIRTLPDAEYFEVMARLIKKHNTGKNGTVCFCSRDLERMPSDFAKKNGIDVSDKPIDIADGFVIRFGDIEENCTLTALAESKNDTLKDAVARVLF